jgi:hypothetical protein
MFAGRFMCEQQHFLMIDEGDIQYPHLEWGIGDVRNWHIHTPDNNIFG